ncbi:MAG: hypothetical protein BWY63_03709 [Chloroflexi bacterium ADurb.Bin360]|nr:MAG: hypothetical protein BWY63_03709 [Chloroflexi bacterium ADurb.Bin360]
MTRIPDEDHRLHQVLQLTQGNGTATGEHQHDFRAMRRQAFDVLHLHSGQTNARAVTVLQRENGVPFLALQERRKSHTGNGHVAFARFDHRPIMTVLVHMSQAATGTVFQAGTFRHRANDALQQRRQRIAQPMIIAQ